MTKAKIRDKYTAIFSEYYPVVYNAVNTKVVNKQDTEDICQEVFIALYRNMDKIENIRKWLFGTLKNSVLKYYRDREPENADIDKMFNDISLTFVNGFRDTRVLLSEAIDEEVKNDTEQMLIDLIAYHNYSYRTVADILGITRRRVEYAYTQLVDRILDNLSSRGINNIEDLL